MMESRRDATAGQVGRVVVEGGVSEDRVLEAMRLGSVVHAAAVGLELGG